MILQLLLISLVIAIQPEKFKDLLIYEIQVASYFNGDKTIGFSNSWGPNNADWGGDLQGIINNLPKIASWGFNAIWMTPIFNTKYTDNQKDIEGENGWKYCENHSSCGYFIADYYTIDPHFGTNEKFKELVETAHANNIYVILDGVFGHIKPTICGTGIPEHDEKSPICVEGACSETSTDSKMDYNEEETYEFFEDIVKYWIKEYKIDGWRIDAPYELSKTLNAENHADEETIANNFVYKFREAVELAADENKQNGDKWGILGFMMTDEKFKNMEDVKNWYGPEDKKTAYTWYDWPGIQIFRETIIQEFEENEEPSFDDLIETLTYINEYPSWSYPIFCSANHDFLRLGNSIERRWGYIPEDEKYWDLHLSYQLYQIIYPGLISMYYGEEMGEYCEGYHQPGDLGAYDDNAGRSNPTEESDMTNAQKKHRETIISLLKWRKEKPIFRCRNCQTIGEEKNGLFVLKRTNSDSNDKMKYLYYILNLNNVDKKINLQQAGKFQDVVTKTDIDLSKEITIKKQSAILIVSKVSEENGSNPSGSGTSGTNNEKKNSCGSTLILFILTLFVLLI